MLSKKEKLQKKRIAFGKDVYQINPNNKPTKIQIKPFLNDFKSLSVRLRIFIALDCREERIIRILCDNKIVGSFDIRFAYVNQVFETSLQLPASCEKIFLVQTKGLSSTYIYKENPFSPVLISEQTSENPISSFFTTLNSDLIIQPFGWMEGCVLDGLLTLNKMEEIQNHLSHFIINDNLVYENPRSKIADNTLYGIEGALPFAFITSPKVLEIFDDFVSNYSSSELITDAEFVSAEGCYTLAYPLAKRAISSGKKIFADKAISQIIERKKLLRSDSSLYLRNNKGVLSYKDWGRAYVWYLLGILQIYKTLGDLPIEIISDFKILCEKLLSITTESSLYFAYINEKETGTEISASAGIASVFHLGYCCGLLSKKYELRSLEIRKKIESTYILSDGFLFNCGQSNRNGETFQRSGYRVISQIAMGLFSHCYYE